MIVGDGDIASVLKDRDGFTFFASGVSNSQETRGAEYQREIDLLLQQDPLEHLVYFSSLAIFYNDNQYAQHKLRLENMIRRHFPSYTIVRLGNITWGTNPNTLINYLKVHPEAEIRDEYRYVVGKEEFLYWMDMLPSWNCEFNITGQWLKVKQIKEKYAK